MKINKLIRDKIPEIITQDGQTPVTHIARTAEFKKKLFEKLGEECAEFIESESVEELADILEIIYAICDLKGISVEELEKIRIDKRKKRGGFEKKIILDEIR